MSRSHSITKLAAGFFPVLCSVPQGPPVSLFRYNGLIVNQEKTGVAEQAPEQPTKAPKSDIPRGVIAEWTVTIILLLFGTTTLVQAFVIPTGSMEDTLMIGAGRVFVGRSVS